MNEPTTRYISLACTPAGAERPLPPPYRPVPQPEETIASRGKVIFQGMHRSCYFCVGDGGLTTLYPPNAHTVVSYRAKDVTLSGMMPFSTMNMVSGMHSAQPTSVLSAEMHVGGVGVVVHNMNTKRPNGHFYASV